MGRLKDRGGRDKEARDKPGALIQVSKERNEAMTKSQVKDSMLQQIYLLQELDQAVLLIDTGLAMLQLSRPCHRKTFVFLTLLASGIERLLKIVLCLRAIEVTGKFLTKKELKAFSHNLAGLVAEVVSQCFTAGYLKRPIAQQDFDFLRADQLMQGIIELISDFAKADRYIFMDGISDPAIAHEWPDRRWEELEKLSLEETEYMELLVKRDVEEITKRANKKLVAHFERFLRAISRLFVLAELGTEARSKSPAVSHFYMLRDSDLGAKAYTIE